MSGEDKQFTIKDSGERAQFASGMVRDVTTEKTDYSLALDGPLFERLAKHLTAGAKKYAKRNWMKASGQEELDRFRESALRHFIQWYRGDKDEDHFAAVAFNMNGKEYVADRMNQQCGTAMPGRISNIEPRPYYHGGTASESEPEYRARRARTEG